MPVSLVYEAFRRVNKHIQPLVCVSWFARQQIHTLFSTLLRRLQFFLPLSLGFFRRETGNLLSDFPVSWR
jgi:hypothetical protein